MDNVHTGGAGGGYLNVLARNKMSSGAPNVNEFGRPFFFFRVTARVPEIHVCIASTASILEHSHDQHVIMNNVIVFLEKQNDVTMSTG